MSKHYLLVTLLLLLSIHLTSCNRSSTNTSREDANKHDVVLNKSKESIDDNFSDFIKKFSIDSTFQLSRITFPLKIQWRSIDQDTLFYYDRSEHEMMDFRKEKSTTLFNRWKQTILIDQNNTSATIEIRGIDNGIMIDYVFEKIHRMWMLVEVIDSST